MPAANRHLRLNAAPSSGTPGKIGFWNGVLLLALLLSAASLNACHTAQVSVPASTEPMPTAAATTTERAVRVEGRLFSSQDSTTVISGVELIFRKALADSTGFGLRAVTGPDGSYQVKLNAGLVYQITFSKDGQKLGTQQYFLPGMPADTGSLVHNFYGDYTDMEPMVDGLPMIFFDTNQASLRPEAKTRLDSFIPILKDNPRIGISAEGHAEPHEVPHGQAQPDQYLMQLGLRRAQAAAEYLKKRGVSANKTFTKSFGGKQLVAPNDNPENRQLNRRVEFKIVLLEDIAVKRKAAEHGPASATKPYPRLTGSKYSSSTRKVKKAPTR